MKRAPLTLAAVAAALAAITGAAALTAPASGSGSGAADGRPAAAAARMPVERSTLTCPAPSSSDVAETAYTSLTPGGGPAGGGGTARLVGATPEAKQLLELKEPGKPTAATASGAEAPALTGTADGTLAPGWTAQLTTKVAVGQARGLLGVACAPPGTDFWFPAVSTGKGRHDYVHLTNSDDTPAVVDVQLFGPDGAVRSEQGGGENIKVGPRSSVAVLLSTLVPGQFADLTAHVTTRSGRVGAVVQVQEDGVGADWLPASADPAGRLVLPGIPADATSVRLVAYAPGRDDADLRIRLAGPGGSISPAQNEELHVKAGMTAVADLGDVTRGEPGSLVLTPADPGQAVGVVAALRVVRGTGSKQELGFVAAAGPVGARATVAEQRTEQSSLVLSLTVPAGSADARVKVTVSEGAAQEHTVKAGTTLALTPAGGPAKGPWAVTVETVSGGPVHAARTLTLPADGVPLFTTQPLVDDRSTVEVPTPHQDLTVLTG
ncbi:DUF5719 family protein [Streptomyces antimicrobicus]|uniref:DUF5719 family protein n=1 Tax=Streptomyces antimicrobicus TaxID=2883108 RepID=A0ABS8BEU4_9ACTN|nr:DUF5719 family protein [Streptomyces antimicrobicus]MCB5183169.1 DUF5719 family protein [Streptomyces antimicrobicus]